ncbi:MAG: NAD(P)-dependent alcohol dehydrogenase [Xanthomonadaceae bacterium]|nr:NAD(P)-dependent alcohol dehydrogenase [Xanthomonadaceae bacterium]
MKTAAYAALTAKASLAPYTIDRREPGPHEISIDILYCGVCHSDLHQVCDEWGGAIFPMVPGHEIVGKVAKIGAGVSKYNVGDSVGVGCFVDSCRECEQCKMGEEQYCEQGMTPTYNGYEHGTQVPTYGGYSTRITVHEDYVLRIPESIPLDRAAPLLCAGITTYSPLRHYGLKAGDRLGVVGLGGLGHMAVKFSRALSAEVTVLSTSEAKREAAMQLGAHAFTVVRDKAAFKALSKRFDFIIDTVSAPHDYNLYLSLLRTDGTMVLLGIPERPAPVAAGALIMQRRKLGGSLIGGIRETQEMLDFCAEHGIASDIELIDAGYINDAYERMLKGDVHYRFVIDIATLKKAG